MGLLTVLDGLLARLILAAGSLRQRCAGIPLPIIAGIALILVVRKLLVAPAQLEAEQDGEVEPRSPKASGSAAEAFFRRQGAPDYNHIEGVCLPGREAGFSNGPPISFTNEVCVGKFLNMHRATFDKELGKSGEYPNGPYFKGKKRLWEVRLQLRFTSSPPRQKELFFGIELSKYVPMNSATKRSMAVLVRSLKGVVGDQIYHSAGDDPEKVTSGELEQPLFVMPMWAFDQFIVTPEGQTPPDLYDAALPEMGSKRSTRVKEFRQELDSLEFEVGPTYTFCFWGISQWLDKLSWKIKMPLMSPIDFNRFCGKPPVSVAIYTLKEGAEKRHLQSRKKYYLRVQFWPSQERPEPETLSELLGKDALNGFGDSHDVAAGSALPSGAGALRKRAGAAPARGSFFACCSSR